MILKRFCWLLFAVAVLAFSLGSRASENASSPVKSPAAESVHAAYIVQPGDLLQVSVWKESEIAREVLIRPDGGLSFPSAGDDQASRLTVPELEQELTKRIRKYIPEAVVTVAIRDPRGDQFFVAGRVNRPGQFTSLRPIDVMQALSFAGSATPFASLNDIRVLRRANGTETSIPHRYGRTEKGKSLKDDKLLQRGIVVVVS
jgi:polysaccharide export outer membrane protein